MHSSRKKKHEGSEQKKRRASTFSKMFYDLNKYGNMLRFEKAGKCYLNSLSFSVHLKCFYIKNSNKLLISVNQQHSFLLVYLHWLKHTHYFNIPLLNQITLGDILPRKEATVDMNIKHSQYLGYSFASMNSEKLSYDRMF